MGFSLSKSHFSTCFLMYSIAPERSCEREGISSALHAKWLHVKIQSLTTEQAHNSIAGHQMRGYYRYRSTAAVQQLDITREDAWIQK